METTNKTGAMRPLPLWLLHSPPFATATKRKVFMHFTIWLSIRRPKNNASYIRWVIVFVYWIYTHTNTFIYSFELEIVSLNSFEIEANSQFEPNILYVYRQCIILNEIMFGAFHSSRNLSGKYMVYSTIS